MNHPDWPAFVAAIVAEPDDDTPRLVAADFLDENGDPDRAAFVRAQVGLARLEASGLGKSLDADELRKRERAFLGTFADYPLFWGMEACPELVRMPPGRSGSPLAGLHVEGANRLTWHRGFVAGVTCPTAEWLRHGAEVRRRNPVEWVTLARCEAVPRDAWYVGLPALRGLRDVRLFGFPDPDRGGELVTWLRGWLPGTRVEWSPV